MLMRSNLTSAALLAISLFAVSLEAAEPPSAKALWTRNMGQSGLRRFYSTGADLGEMVNRQVSYQMANRLATARKAAAPSAVIDPDDFASTAEGYVGQYDSLWTVSKQTSQPLFLRTLARTAKRLEGDKVHSTNNRYDLGLLYGPSQNSYVGLGYVHEKTAADLKYVTGNTDITANGLRLDTGYRFSPVFALGLRAEQLQFSGDNSVRPGATTISRPLDYRRRYLQMEGIVRLNAQQWKALPAWLQVGGMTALHALDTRYDAQRNSLGQSVVEPFGNSERLVILRSGVFASATVGSRAQWNPYAELMLDRELQTDMSYPLNDRTSALLRMGVARLLGPGKRLSLEYQRSQSHHSLRERNNLLLVAVLDF